MNQILLSLVVLSGKVLTPNSNPDTDQKLFREPDERRQSFILSHDTKF